ncbi:MAG: head maturation protease, ClpP-related [Pseudomonadota bacterium]
MRNLNAALQVRAKGRPGALPMPHEQRIGAYTKPEVFDRWTDVAAKRGPAAQGNVIEMYDVIGYDWWDGGGVTAKGVSDQLKAFKGQPVTVMINSPGGNMFEGIAIYNLLRERDGEITVKIVSLAASAASVIAMAGDRIEISAASFLMIHNCWVVAIGNRNDMQATAEWLAPFDAAIAEVYAMRSGRTVEECASWMDAETYMSGATAIERGFADALLSADATDEDPAAGAKARDIATVRSTEQALLASGMTRTQARAHINQIKGKREAAPEAMQDAGEPAWVKNAQALIDTLKG